MKLKPCPFCGSEIIIGEYESDFGGCTNADCPCFFYRDLKKDSLGIWNTRPIEDQQAAEIEILKEQVEQLHSVCGRYDADNQNRYDAEDQWLREERAVRK